jgi:hypothetical protein
MTTPPWQPYPIALACSSDCRSPECLRAVLKQFDVGANPRYLPNQQGYGETYCNVYLWDATRALECEIPHWCGDNGEPLQVGKGRELSAAGVIGWLRTFGSANGWREVPLESARDCANRGLPAVATWLNPSPGKPSHVAMLLPDADGQCRIAQAGAACFFDDPLERGFGRLKVACWVHD